MKHFPAVLFLYLLLFQSCTGSDDLDTLAINTYITNNNLQVKDTLGIYIHVTQRGTDTITSLNSNVDLAYMGRYLDNLVFDSSPEGKPVTLKLNTALESLRNGILQFGRGGKGIIIIPPSLGFKNNTPRGIRENSTLIFEISVVDFD